MRNLIVPSLVAAFVCALLSAFNLSSPAIASENQSVMVAASRKADVFLFRGFGDVFSRGLDEIASGLQKRRVKATVVSHLEWQSVVSKVIENRRKFGRRPVILIGHSLGANAALRAAKALKKKRIPVTYMATFAATAPPPAPSNVRKLTNYYFKTDGWGEAVKRGPGFRGILKNVDFSKDKTIGHFNIEKQPRLQRQVIRNVLRHVRRSKRAARVAENPTSTKG